LRISYQDISGTGWKRSALLGGWTRRIRAWIWFVNSRFVIFCSHRAAVSKILIQVDEQRHTREHAFSRTTRELLSDGGRLIQRNAEILPSWPMHVHWSSLPFAPRDTALFHTYGGLNWRRLDVVYGFEKTWKPLIAILRGHGSPVHSIKFSADGSRFASASRDPTIRLWDGITGTLIAILKGHVLSIKSLAFSPDSSGLTSASDDGVVRLWDDHSYCRA
jgi:WD40 repeat protein